MSNVGVEGENSVGRTLEPVRLGISTDIRAEMAEIVGNIVSAATSVAKSDTVSAIAIGREATSEASKNIAATSSRVSKRTAALLQNTVSSGLRASADIRAEMADIVASIIPAAIKVVKTDTASAVAIGREATSETSKNIAATSSRVSKRTAALLQNTVSSGLRASADIRAEMADIVASIIPAATKVVKTDTASAVAIGREASTEASKNIAATSVRFSTNAANLLENSLNTMSQLTPSLTSGTMSSFFRTIPQQLSLSSVTTLMRGSNHDENVSRDTGVVRNKSMPIGITLNHTLRQISRSGHALIYPSPFKMSWELDSEPLIVGMVIDESHLNATCIRVNESRPSIGEALQFVTDGMRIISGTAARIDPSRSYGDGDVQIEITYHWAPSKSKALTKFQNLTIGTLLRSAGNFDFKAVGKLLDPSDIASNNSEEVERVLTIKVGKHRPVIQWMDPDDIVYGTDLNLDDHLNAICLPITLPSHIDVEGPRSLAIDGNWDYQPAAGTRLPAGHHDLKVTFFPDDNRNYESPIEKSVKLCVQKYTPRIIWDFPKTLHYGEKLQYASRPAVCLESSICDGIFEYDPPEERTLHPAKKKYELKVMFKPSDTLNFNIAQASCSVYVEPYQLEICWEAPAPIEYGTCLCHEQLNAKCNINISGYFEYEPPSSIMLPAGDDNRLSVSFQPFDKDNFLPAIKTVFIKVFKKKPSLKWYDPAPILFGTPVKVDILNAVCVDDIEGRFDYDVSPGTRLPTGIHFILAKFTPEDQNNFDFAEICVPLSVLRFLPTLLWTTPNNIASGTKLSTTQLCAICVEEVEGVFEYFPAAETILSCGEHTLNVTFTPTDSLNYVKVDASVTVQVDEVMLTLYSNPVDKLPCGTKLIAEHINAICRESVEGTFVYEPPLGSLLTQPGSQEVKVTFEPLDYLNYDKVSMIVSITVIKFLPSICWQVPSTMFYGQLLSENELNAECVEDLTGEYIYTPPLGYRLNAGLMQILHVKFIPAVDNNYVSAEHTVLVDVLPSQPVIKWDTPSAISYGTGLSDIQLNAFSVEGVAGTFDYDPPIGSILPSSDSFLLHCDFLPDDNHNYTTVRSCVSLTIMKTVPTLSWTQPSAIHYRTPLSSLELNAICIENIPGKFLYNPLVGVVLPADESHTLTVNFIPDDSMNFLPASHFVSLEVKKFYPTLVWEEPAGLPFSSRLTGVQLNSFCPDNVDGDFEYNPPHGTVLSVGIHNLNVTFTPKDTRNFHIANGTVSVTVVEALRPTIVWPQPSSIIYGTPLSIQQLCAYSVDSIDGEFEYTPPLGSILDAGSANELSAIFRPNDSVTYTTVKASVILCVEKLSTSLSWVTPADIKVGTHLDELQLNAVCNEGFQGVFKYDPSFGTVLSPGSDQPLFVTFIPFDSTNISQATLCTKITVVEPRNLHIIWSQPSPINYGIQLTSVQLNAICKEFEDGEVDGVLEYNVSNNSVLHIGDHELTVVFKPYDSIHFSVTSASVFLTVEAPLSTIRHNDGNSCEMEESLSTVASPMNECVEELAGEPAPSSIELPMEVPSDLSSVSPRLTTLPPEPSGVPFSITTISQESAATASIHSTDLISSPRIVNLRWFTPNSIVFGTKLTERELNAEVENDCVEGEFVYTPSHGEVLPSGKHVLDVEFKPSDPLNYSASSMQVEIIVTPFKPTILWNPPNFVPAGTLLTEQMVHATCEDFVEGTFQYHPPIGTVMKGGTEICVRVEFIPVDTHNFSSAMISETVSVDSPHQPTIIWREQANIPYGTLLSSSQLCAVVVESIEGEFIYDPPCGFKLNAGVHNLCTKFLPFDDERYAVAEKDIEICVEAIKPSIIWRELSPIVYGTPLSNAQLNATCAEEVEGEWDYNPIEGTLLNPGMEHQLSVIFRPFDKDNCYVAQKSVTLSVIEPSAVTLIWPAPPSIVYGEPLSDLELNAHCPDNVPGRFEYHPDYGSILTPSESHTLSVSFYPDDNIRHKATSLSVSVLVEKAVPKVRWENPSRIFYGTALSEEQLNASCDEVHGVYTYTPSMGTVLGLGMDQSLSVDFAPTDTSCYISVTKAVLISVLQRSDVNVVWNTPEPIFYGTPLSDSILNAVVDKPFDGYFVYNYPVGTILFAGFNQKLTVTFTSKENKYVELQKDVCIDVLKVVTSIRWESPSPIRLGTALSSTELNAICDQNINGTFIYDPPLGAVLPKCENNCLSVEFTPMDDVNYCSSKASVSITVIEPKVVTLTWNSPANIVYGTVIDDKQLNAKCLEFDEGLIGGSFEYNVVYGSCLSAGIHELIATFKPSDQLFYQDTSATVTLIVEKVLSSLSWSSPANIKLGSPLTTVELSAVCNESIDGLLIFDPPLGTVLPAGLDHVLSVQFVPKDGENFAEAQLSTLISVIEPRPVTISWCPPTVLTYGTSLGDEFFTAVCEDQSNGKIDGNFTYNYDNGMVLSPGTYELRVDFKPADQITFLDATASANLVVNKILPTLSWSNPQDFKVGTPLSELQLNATCNENFEGMFEYNHPIGTVLPIGPDQVLSVVFTPSNPETIATACASVNISVIEPRDVAIHWTTPADIYIGAQLNDVQLNAQVEKAVSGELHFNYPSGTVLHVGDKQELSVEFRPDDTLQYNLSRKSVFINVLKKAALLFWELPNNQNVVSITYGTPLREELLCCQVVGDNDIEGSIQYSHQSESILECGTHEVTAVFTPVDLVRFGVSKQSVYISVIPLRCEIQWRESLSDIFYGQLLNSDELDAKQCGSCVVDGSFQYTPPAGTLLDAGENIITCQFVPKDTSRYAPSEKLLVKKLVCRYPTSIGWLEPSTIVYGTELSELQLSAYVLDPPNLAGRFQYEPTFDAQLSAGDHSLHALFVPNSANYSHAEATVTLNVKKAALLIKWESPQRVVAAPLVRFTTAQLNATVSVADPMLRHIFGTIEGAFEYSPAVGDILDLTHDSLQLNVKFIPVDLENFDSCTKSITLLIKRPPLRLTSNQQEIHFGEAVSDKICLFGDIFGGYVLPEDGQIVYPDSVLGQPLAVGNHEIVVAYISRELSLLHSSCEVVLPLVVLPAETTIQWAIPNAIEYGDPLTAEELNAFCSTCLGTFSYSPALGSKLPVGLHEVVVTFSPENENNYVMSTKSVEIEVRKPLCEIKWLVSDPELQAGDLAGEKVFNTVCWHVKCNAAVSGQFTYSVDADYKFIPGSITLLANFLPDDMDNYPVLSLSREVVVEKITPSIQWIVPEEVAFLTNIAEEHLAVVSMDSDGQDIAGTFVFDPPAGTILDKAGKTLLHVEFSPTDENYYKPVSCSVYVNVQKGLPTLQWIPSCVTSVDLVDPNIYFQPKFCYQSIPVEGNVSRDIRNNGVLIDQQASVRFTAGNIETLFNFEPDDNENFASVSDTIVIPVERGRIRLFWPVPVPITYGTRLDSDTLSAHCVDLSEPGKFVYEPDTDSLLSAGQHRLSVRFIPDDSLNYDFSEEFVNLTVNKALPKVEWFQDIASIAFSSTADDDTLRRFWQSSVPGQVKISHPSDLSELHCGQHDLAVTFVPDDSQNYDSVQLLGVLTVVPTTAEIRSDFAECEVEYEVDLTIDILRDLLGLYVAPSISGEYHWANGNHSSLNLDVGTNEVEVLFEPEDHTNYNISKAVFTVLVRPTKIEFVWADLRPTLIFESPLTKELLCAVAVVVRSGEHVLSGAYEYMPSVGTILPAGEHSLTVTFTPLDRVHMSTAIGNAIITVLPKEVRLACSPVPLTYGSVLLESDLTVRQDRPDQVPGTLTYSTENIFDALLEAGEHDLTVQFHPTEESNFISPALKVTIVVLPRQPDLIWVPPKRAIEFGQPLSAAELNAECVETAGTLTYSMQIGDVLEVGQHVVSVTFTPIDSKNFVAVEKQISLTVIITPALSISIQPLQFGDVLSSGQMQFDARFNGEVVPGSWRLSPDMNGIIEVGEHQLTVDFTPENLQTYRTATATATLSVQCRTPPVRWSALQHPPSLTYGTPLTAAQHLNAICETQTIAGRFEYNFSDGQVLQPGSYELSAHFIPADEAHYTRVSHTVVLSVLKIVPAMVWVIKPPPSIDYGVALTQKHLQASPVSVRGIVTYSPPLDCVLSGGRHTLTANLIPEDSEHYSIGSLTASIVVNRLTPTLTWSAPGSLPFGRPLTELQLCAQLDGPFKHVKGRFVYSPGLGRHLSTLPVGPQILRCEFIPDESENFNPARSQVNIEITKTKPELVWDKKVRMLRYGTPLNRESHLNARYVDPFVTADFSYDKSPGQILDVGHWRISLIARPHDKSSYYPDHKVIDVLVEKAIPEIEWSPQGSLSAGDSLTSAQLCATLSKRFFEQVHGLGQVNYTLVYDPPIGSRLRAGQHDLTVTVHCGRNFEVVEKKVTINADRALPVLVWNTLENLSFGQVIESDTHLNAVALSHDEKVPGTYFYEPPAGTVLSPGQHTITLRFEPTDEDNFCPVEQTQTFTVNRVAPIILWSGPSSINFGVALTEEQLNARLEDAALEPFFICSYTPPLGHILPAGVAELTVTYLPNPNLPPEEAARYSAASCSVSITVNKIQPRLLWSGLPDQLGWDNTLQESKHLNARCVVQHSNVDVAGSFRYYCDDLPLLPGKALPPGSHEVKCEFFPADDALFSGAVVTRQVTVDKKDPLLTWNPPEHARIYTGVPLTSMKQPDVCNAECVSDCVGRFTYQVRETQADKSCVVLAKFTPVDSYARIFSEVTLTRVMPVGGSYADWAALPKPEDRIVEPLLLYGDNRVFTMFPYKDKHYADQGYSRSPLRSTARAKSAGASSGERSRTSPTRSGLLSARKS